MDNNSPKKDLTEGGKVVNTIWQRLQEKATEIGYGSFTCEMQIHDGIIKQVDITETKERFRID